MAQRCLVIGSETLSRVVDDHDRDSMIYSDGAGASIIEASDDDTGMLSYESGTMDEANYLFFGKSYNPNLDPDTRYIKMHGQNLRICFNHCSCCYEKLPRKSGIAIDEVKKILIHQTNEKMDETIIQRFL
jgi:3-oxoacyl-[acyl-carrier-protein] synthase-3